MLYNETNPILKIIGVEHLQWSGNRFRIPPRPFSALAFRIRGSARISTKEGDFLVEPNDILYFPQNIAYTAEYTDTEMIVIHFITAEDDPAPKVFSFENGERYYQLFQQAHAQWQGKETGYHLRILSILYDLLAQLTAKEAAITLPKHFLQAVSHINANYRSNALSIDAICAEAGISQTVFRTLFKKYYQKSPIAYITDLRLEYARNLIAGGAPIETAALESGFNDPKYFARTVKKHFGCTPRNLKTYGK